MSASYYRLRWRIARRRWTKRLRRGWHATTRFVKAFIWGRSRRLKYVRRFMAGWGALMLIAVGTLALQQRALSDYYLSPQPSSGGTYIEGTLGSFTAINPLFAETTASRAASRLIFSGLAKYNGQGKAVPDLAEGWQVSDDGVTYTVVLRDNLLWQDGEPLTSEDVVYTVETIQNPEVGSLLNASWRDIKAEAVDARTVKFTLPNPYSPFGNNLTTGLVPKHILTQTKPAELRINSFNQQPVGAGPYELERFLPENNEVQLRANPNYGHGEPRISRFVIRSFHDYDQLLEAIRSRRVSGAGGFDVLRLADFAELEDLNVTDWPQGTVDLAFFNTARPLLGDRGLRRALVQAIDPLQLALNFNNQIAPARSPLLPQQVGYASDILQLRFDLEKAKTELSAAGWQSGADNLRSKDGQVLKLELVAQNAGIYPEVARWLQQQWQKLGAQIEIKLEASEILQQTYTRPRNYDILLTGITIGADPDVYAFWHSSQIQDPGLNLSQYRSTEADAGLEGGRTREDPRVRAAKYRTFLTAWQQDAPAVALLQPYYFYASRGLREVDIEWIAEPIVRFHNVHNWAVKTEPALKRLQ